MAIPLGAGGGSASYPTIFLSKSQTWVPPQDGNICIHVIGAGGSGSGGTDTGSNTEAAGGGGAGGYCRKNSLAVTTSGSYTVVIGAGHVPTLVNTAGGSGGNTTFAGTGLGSTLTANGGAGHPKGPNSAAGGSASGGDVNNTGGAGSFKKGGGAVGLTGTGNQGFDPGPSSSRLYFGGGCDVIGDFWSSSLGQLAGSIGGRGLYDSDGAYDGSGADAGPLAGGGMVHIGSGYNYQAGGAATIGGGGGGCIFQTGSYAGLGGRGGEGIVVIQYIP